MKYFAKVLDSTLKKSSKRSLTQPCYTPSLEMGYERFTINHQNIAIFLSVCWDWNARISSGETPLT